MKKIALILAALMLAVSLIACNNIEADGDKASAADTKKTDKTHEVTMVVNGETINVGTITYEEEKGKNVSVTVYNGLDTDHAVKIDSVFVHDNTEYTPTSIGNQAFYYRTSVISIELPSTITTIGDEAFAGCTGLETIVIPASVKHIGEGAFAECTNLKSVIFEEGSQLETIDFLAFANCTSLETISIPEGVETLGAGAFYNCVSITAFKTPSSLKSIDDGAFMGCTGLNQQGALDVSASVNIETKIENVAGEKVEIVCLGEHIFGNINKNYIVVPTDSESEIAKYVAAMASAQETEQ